jgi:folate-binding protein YgfZ
MSSCQVTNLAERGIVAVTGEQARTFLQGMISNDIGKVSPQGAIYSAFLTSQGRYQHDFFVVQAGDALLLDCEPARAADLARRLTVYRLRAKVTIEVESDRWAVAAVYGGPLPASLGLAGDRGSAAPFAGGVAFVDPRLAEAGARIIVPRERLPDAVAALGCAESPFEEYDVHRLRLGLPDGSRDLEVERSILIENGFDELGGVSWDKGCYIGQELNANSRRLVIRKRLMPVEIVGPAPEPGTKLTAAAAGRGGEMRSSCGRFGLAMVRTEHLDQDGHAEFTAGQARVRAWWPDWMTIKRPEAA